MLKLKCPRCGSDDLTKSGVSDANAQDEIRQRWKCHNSNCTTKGGWHGTAPLGIEIYDIHPERFDGETPAIPPEQVRARVRDLNAYKKDADVATFVITSAQNATPVHENFWNNLLALCDQTGGQPIVIPFRYKNVTSHWSQKAATDDYWMPEVQPFCVNHRFHISRTCEVLADIKIQPTRVDPLTGLESVSGEKHAILAHPKLRLKCIPTLPGKKAKIMTTTGACTVPNYTPTMAGKKSEFHHVMGATLVQTRGTKTFIYQIVADSKGDFIHRDVLYEDGEAFEAPHAIAVVMGDTHADWIAKGVLKATFADDTGMVNVFKPECLIWHDVMDSYSISHHHERPDMFFTRLAKHENNRANIKDEITRAFDLVNQYAPDDVQNVFPFSNHPNEHLWKWLNSKDPRLDYQNFGFWLETWTQMHNNMIMGPAGAETVDPFAFWGMRMLNQPDNAVFLGPNDSFVRSGVDLGAHGHLGPNGARATVGNLARLGHKGMTGHGHSPEIFEGHTRVGKSTGELEYEKGPGSGMQCHGVLYANGKRALYFIDGEDWELT